MNAPSYTTLNLAAQYEVSERIACYGRISNLLNRHYQSPIGFDQMGIGALAGIKVMY